MFSKLKCITNTEGEAAIRAADRAYGPAAVSILTTFASISLDALPFHLLIPNALQRQFRLLVELINIFINLILNIGKLAFLLNLLLILCSAPGNSQLVRLLDGGSRSGLSLLE